MKLSLYNPLSRVFITQHFGIENTTPEMQAKYKSIGLGGGHNGMDMVASDGTPVFASHDGRVTFTGYDDSGGLGVVIRTTDPVEFKDGTIAYAKTIYWHLQKGSVLVTGGQDVKAGQQIACADNTGFSTGSHLHFGLKPIAKGENDWTWYNTQQDNGYNGAIDPEPYLVPFQQDMKFGETWEDLIKLQKALKQLGFFTGEPFAKYGKMTADAVLKFQLQYCNLSWYEKNILKGNTFGPKTRQALNDLWFKGKITV